MHGARRPALPAAGSARLARLADQTIVWVVHLRDGTQSVVSAWQAGPNWPLIGAPNLTNISSPVHWTADAARFEGHSMFDARGVNVFGGVVPNLAAFRVRALDSGRLQVFGPAAPRIRREVMEPVLERRHVSTTNMEAELRALLDPALTLEQALEAPEGRLLTIAADLARVGTHPEARLCPATGGTADHRRCHESGVVVKDMRVLTDADRMPFQAPHEYPHGALPGELYFLRGPLLARREGRAFVDVHGFAGGELHLGGATHGR